MGLSSIYNRIALISPYCEIALRHLFEKNVEWFGKFRVQRYVEKRASDSINNTQRISIITINVITYEYT